MWACILRLRDKWLGTTSTIQTPVYDSIIKQLNEIHLGVQEVRNRISEDKEMLIKELKKRNVIINTMIEYLPDMLWFKDIDGRYIYANKAIRENLLFSDNPLGKTDIELAENAKKLFGDRNHTFGEVCGNSDKDVLDNCYLGKRYVESGLVKGRLLVLEVNKSMVTLDGEVIGVVGSGRDITEYREELIKNGEIDVFKRNEFINKDV